MARHPRSSILTLPRSSTNQIPQPCSLDHMPLEIILAIMEMFSSNEDVLNFTSIYTRAKYLLKDHKASILRNILKRIIHPSNLDIALITFGLLRLSRQEDLEQETLCLSALTEMPTLDFMTSAVDSLEQLLDLVSSVNYMVRLYAYPDCPEAFWKDAVRKYDRTWPESDRPIHGVYILDEKSQMQCRQMAERFWFILGVVESPQDHAISEHHRPVRHSPELMARIQREFFAFELQSRVSILQRLTVIPDQWVEDETHGVGVARFLEMAENVYVHTISQNDARDDVEVLKYMRRSGWGNASLMGVRHWTTILRAGQEEATMKSAECISRVINDTLIYYQDPSRPINGQGWFWELQSVGWAELSNYALALWRRCEALEEESRERQSGEQRSPNSGGNVRF